MLGVVCCGFFVGDLEQVIVNRLVAGCDAYCIGDVKSRVFGDCVV